VDIVEVLKLVLPGIPNFAGFLLMAVYFSRMNNRMLDLIEKLAES